MVAFEGWPKLKLPAATTEHKERMSVKPSVGEAGQPRTNPHVAIEDLREAGLLKNVVLTAVEHLDLATMILVAGTLIRAQLKHRWNAFHEAPDGRNYRVHPGTPLRASSLT